MKNILGISEATSLAMHAAAYLAGQNGTTSSTAEIADALLASRHHLSKVLQRMARAGIVRSVRGPRGGFVLAEDGANTTLLDVYRALEGSHKGAACLLPVKICPGADCIMGGLVQKLEQEVADYLGKTSLTDLEGIIVNPVEVSR